MEYGASCMKCPWAESWDTDLARQAAALWHVYEEHRDLWVEILGDRPPVVPRPEFLGRRFQEWESQL